MPKALIASTIECSGNSRSLLKEKASGNPWTIGGVGNAVWGGVWLRDLLAYEINGEPSGCNRIAPSPGSQNGVAWENRRRVAARLIRVAGGNAGLKPAVSRRYWRRPILSP